MTTRAVRVRRDLNRQPAGHTIMHKIHCPHSGFLRPRVNMPYSMALLPPPHPSQTAETETRLLFFSINR